MASTKTGLNSMLNVFDEKFWKVQLLPMSFQIEIMDYFSNFASPQMITKIIKELKANYYASFLI